MDFKSDMEFYDHESDAVMLTLPLSNPHTATYHGMREVSVCDVVCLPCVGGGQALPSRESPEYPKGFSQNVVTGTGRICGKRY